MRSMFRTVLYGSLFSALALSAAAPSQAAYPDKPVTIVVPWAAGGSTDILGRLVAQYLGESLHQTFIVENRTGASGNIGSSYVARAQPDGYTLLLGVFSTHVINPSLFNSMPFDGVKDFTPIAKLAEVTTTMVINAEVPANNVKEFISYVKAHPDEVSFATAGTGSFNQIAAIMFTKAAGLKMNDIPYRGGAPAVLDTVANRTQLLFTAATQTLPYVQSGKLKLLAVTDPKRAQALPDTPTLGEILPGYSMSVWYGMFGPKGMDPKLVATLNAEIDKVLRRPEVVEKMNAMAVELTPGTPAQFAKVLQDDAAKYAAIMKDLNLEKQ
jgi:tripartite-type tricarboxylate transporter receptor subunit TctC